MDPLGFRSRRTIRVLLQFLGQKQSATLAARNAPDLHIEKGQTVGTVFGKGYLLTCQTPGERLGGSRFIVTDHRVYREDIYELKVFVQSIRYVQDREWTDSLIVQEGEVVSYHAFDQQEHTALGEKWLEEIRHRGYARPDKRGQPR